MGDDFERAFQIVVGEEKGYVVDSGGPTMYGITQDVAKRNGYQGDMRLLPLAAARAIYENSYWKAASCDELQWPLSCFVFDAAVNQGVQTAIKLLQRALGVAQDGLLGRTSLAAVNRLPRVETCSLFMAYRALSYTGTRGFDTYGKGWLKRLFDVAQAAA